MTPESLARELSIAQAACLWCDLPFSILLSSKSENGIPAHPEHPELELAALALATATESEELPGGINVNTERLLPIPDRTINRDSLKDWLSQHHPEHRPASLFSKATRPATDEVERLTRQLSASHRRIAELKAKLAEATESSPEQPAPKSHHKSATEGLTHYLKIADVERLTGIGHSTIYARIKKGHFPNQIKLGTRTARWSSSDIAEWQKANAIPKKPSSP